MCVGSGVCCLWFSVSTGKDELGRRAEKWGCPESVLRTHGRRLLEVQGEDLVEQPGPYAAAQLC